MPQDSCKNQEKEVGVPSAVKSLSWGQHIFEFLLTIIPTLAWLIAYNIKPKVQFAFILVCMSKQ